MAKSIKSEAAHELARDLAALEHTTVTNAVTMSLREALDRRQAEVLTAQRRTKSREIVDASALLAILLSEPETQALEERLASGPAPRMSAGTYLEASIVVDSRLDPVTTRLFDHLITSSGVTIESVTYKQAPIARQAYRDFGDCFSYALAKSRDEPLLFKDDDFVHTDIRPAQGTYPAGWVECMRRQRTSGPARPHHAPHGLGHSTTALRALNVSRVDRPVNLQGRPARAHL